MARKKWKWFSVRKPRLTLTKKGLGISGPYLRLGGKRAAVNVSESGVSFSIRNWLGSFNSRRGCSRPLWMLVLVIGSIAFFGGHTRPASRPRK